MGKKKDNDLMFEVLNKRVLINGGNGSCLSAKEKVLYLYEYCKKIGLSPESEPLLWYKGSKKIKEGGITKYVDVHTVYATAKATKQLIEKKNISIRRTDRWQDEENFYVEVEAKIKDQSVIDAGFCSKVGFLSSGNAQIAAYTKATRRAVLSICCTGLLDETEIETMSSETTPQNESKYSRANCVVEEKKDENNVTSFLDDLDEIDDNDAEVEAVTESAMEMVESFCDFADDLDEFNIA